MVISFRFQNAELENIATPCHVKWFSRCAKYYHIRHKFVPAMHFILYGRLLHISPLYQQTCSMRWAQYYTNRRGWGWMVSDFSWQCSDVISSFRPRPSSFFYLFALYYTIPNNMRYTRLCNNAYYMYVRVRARNILYVIRRPRSGRVYVNTRCGIILAKRFSLHLFGSVGQAQMK